MDMILNVKKNRGFVKLYQIYLATRQNYLYTNKQVALFQDNF